MQTSGMILNWAQVALVFTVGFAPTVIVLLILWFM